MGGYSMAPSYSLQTTDKNPWGPAQPDLTTALGGAQNAYNTTYNGPNVAALDPMVTQGWNQQAANNNGQTTGAADAGLGSLAGIYGNGGLSQLQIGGANALGGAMSSLNPYVSGQYLQPGQNPYLEASLQKAMQDASQGVNSQFSSAGRYGSGAMANALGTTLGGIQTNARMQDYNQQQQNQLQAMGLLGNMAGQRAGIGQQGVSNLQNAGSALGSLNTAQNLEGKNMAGIGGQKMDYQQQLIDAANQAPWTKVGNLASIAGGIGGLGGTSTSASMGYSPIQNQSSGMNPLGLGMAGLGLGANMMSGGMGTGLMSGFKSLFS